MTVPTAPRRPWTDVLVLLDLAGSDGVTRSDVARLFGSSWAQRAEWPVACQALDDLVAAGVAEWVRFDDTPHVLRCRHADPALWLVDPAPAPLDNGGTS